jgi:hypothetical protein
MKDHEIREYISELFEISIKYHRTQQLRERIRGVVLRMRDSFKKEYSNKEDSDVLP